MAHLTQEHVQHLYDTFGDLKVLDDIIWHRATDDPPTPILGYPRNDDSADDYEQFTGLQLDRFVDAACKWYLAAGLEAVSGICTATYRLPVDCFAKAILEIAESRDRAPPPTSQDSACPPIFYNLVSPRTVSWGEVLDELKVAGLEFTKVSFDEWLHQLRKSAARGEKESSNQAIKLIEYFEEQYASSLTAQNGFKGYGVTFETKAAERDSAVMRSLPSPIENNILQKSVSRWLQDWSIAKVFYYYGPYDPNPPTRQNP